MQNKQQFLSLLAAAAIGQSLAGAKTLSDTAPDATSLNHAADASRQPPVALQIRTGDMNCDALVNFDDINGFVAALVGQGAYEAAYPSCLWLNGDIDGNGRVDFDDVDGFVALLSGATPEFTVRIEYGCLVITDTNEAINLTLRLKAGTPNELELDLGDDGVAEYSYARDLFTCIQVDARGGDDVIRIDEANGVFTDTEITTINGGGGNDQLLGGRGIETFYGGYGNDFIDGGAGNDIAFLGYGDDTFQWDPGDGSDTVEGEEGQDVMVFNGSNGAEIFEFSANAERLRFTRNLGNIVMDMAGIEQLDLRALGGTDTVTVNDLSTTDLTEANIDLAGTLGGTTGDTQQDTVTVNGTSGDDLIDVLGSGTSAAVVGLAAVVNLTNSEGANDALVVNGLGGADRVTATTLPAGVVKLTIDGGIGNDSLFGSQGVDILLGGDGDDFLFGDNGNDLAFMGDGADVFQWDPGDGSDTVEGQAGDDTMLFFGSNAAEDIDIAANGERVRFFRNVGSITMDLNEVERADFRALGGADNVVIGDLTATDMTSVDVDLRGAAGGGDGSADTITVNATNAADVFGATGDAGGVSVFGLPAVVDIFNAETANDRLTLNALGGDDVVDATALEADGIPLTINGGLGADVLIGSAGNDLFNGGDGDDTALMGAGDDTFVWNPGDDNDTLEGQAGFDTMLFNGANVAEQISIFANGGRARFSRDVANVLMDLNDVESIDFTARGGADTITVQDLTGTDVTEINANLESTPGSGTGDGQPDNVIVTGTSGEDVVVLAGDASGTSVFGLAAQVNFTGAESANDRVTVNALAGDDVIEGSGLAVGAIQFTGNGGNDDDVLIGGAGNDTLNGGEGDDVLIGGPGLDILDGGPGDNVIIQD